MNVPPENVLTLDNSYLFDVFGEQFVYEYGKWKLNELIETMAGVQKVRNYFEVLERRSEYPNSSEVMILINSMTYFVFKKSESICMGALLVAMSGFNQHEMCEEKTIDNAIKTRVFVEIIIKCLNMKMMKTGSFFDRYFQKISA